MSLLGRTMTFARGDIVIVNCEMLNIHKGGQVVDVRPGGIVKVTLNGEGTPRQFFNYELTWVS